MNVQNVFTARHVYILCVPYFLFQQFALGIVPVCSGQFRRTFNTTRIPGKEQGGLDSALQLMWIKVCD